MIAIGVFVVVIIARDDDDDDDDDHNDDRELRLSHTVSRLYTKMPQYCVIIAIINILGKNHC